MIHLLILGLGLVNHPAKIEGLCWGFDWVAAFEWYGACFCLLVGLACSVAYVYEESDQPREKLGNIITLTFPLSINALTCFYFAWNLSKLKEFNDFYYVSLAMWFFVEVVGMIAHSNRKLDTIRDVLKGAVLDDETKQSLKG